jgi:hypothetical protein
MHKTDAVINFAQTRPIGRSARRTTHRDILMLRFARSDDKFQTRSMLSDRVQKLHAFQSMHFRGARPLAGGVCSVPRSAVRDEPPHTTISLLRGPSLRTTQNRLPRKRVATYVRGMCAFHAARRGGSRARTTCVVAGIGITWLP